MEIRFRAFMLKSEKNLCKGPSLNSSWITHAIIETLYQWEHPRYRADLRNSGRATILSSDDAFRWFLKEWSVARNLRREFRGEVRLYLDTTLRANLRKQPLNPDS